MRRAVLTEIVRKNVKHAIAKSLTKPDLDKSMATVPKIPNTPAPIICEATFLGRLLREITVEGGEGSMDDWPTRNGGRTVKNRILLENYYLPGDLEAQLG